MSIAEFKIKGYSGVQAEVTSDGSRALKVLDNNSAAIATNTGSTNTKLDVVNTNLVDLEAMVGAAGVGTINNTSYLLRQLLNATIATPDTVPLDTGFIASGALVSNVWKPIATYDLSGISTLYMIEPLRFSFSSSALAYHGRFVARTTLGTCTVVGATDTFTVGASGSVAEFWAELYLEVLVVGAGGSTTHSFTITYTNQDGTTGRSAVVTNLRANAIGKRTRVTLQAGDWAMRSIQNIQETTAGTGGQVAIYGMSDQVTLSSSAANKTEFASINRMAIRCGADKALLFEIASATLTSVTVRYNMNGRMVRTDL